MNTIPGARLRAPGKSSGYRHWNVPVTVDTRAVDAPPRLVVTRTSTLSFDDVPQIRAGPERAS